MIFDDKELTLLSEEEVWGVNGGRQLDVLRQYGTKSAITDLVVLTGGYCGGFCTPDDDTLKGRTGWVYTRSSAGNGYVRAAHRDGSRFYNDSRTRNGAVRPALLSSSVFSQISPNRVRGYNGTEETTLLGNGRVDETAVLGNGITEFSTVPGNAMFIVTEEIRFIHTEEWIQAI